MNLNYFLEKATIELLSEEHQKLTKGGACPFRLPDDDDDDDDEDD